MKDINAIDLFAGAGGLSLAALNCGVDVRAAIEVDKHACLTYKSNIIARHPGIILRECDIEDIDWTEFLAALEMPAGDCDLLLGGPPCQGFSAHRINGTGIGDPRNELLLTYFRVIAAVRPKIFFVENVSGLLWPRHKDYLAAFLSGARAAGYSILGPETINARDFGVPQNRKRVFIVGIRRDVRGQMLWPPAPTHESPERAEDLGKPTWSVAAEVFSKPLPAGDPNSVHMKHSSELRLTFASTPKNGGSRWQSNRVLNCHKDHDGHKDVYGRIDPRKPGPTMTTGCINPSKGRFVHPTANHAITARHCARFQGFPDWFVFEGGLISAGKQIGNAVPIQLGESLLQPIIELLKAQRSKSVSAASR